MKSDAVDILNVYPDIPDRLSVDEPQLNVRDIWLVVNPDRGEDSTGMLGATVSTMSDQVEAKAEKFPALSWERTDQNHLLVASDMDAELFPVTEE